MDSLDHPHAGGENLRQIIFSRPLNGPSPRGWGEHASYICFAACPRTIPTRVGRTPPQTPARHVVTDHPHAGGENHSIALSATAHAGPSPRGWGERGGVTRGVVLLRTIPTRVGRTMVGLGLFHGWTDHPHAGGENLVRILHERHTSGPSPRGWGERAPSATALASSRTIPTRVGRTNSSA